ncbi:MAG TPA: histidine phosphatase family protein [Candidatus Binataceae bacterium]
MAIATLVLVRHGETVGESSIRYHGRTDVALSELGRAQMHAAAGAVRSFRFEHLFSSPLKRAHEGARIIGGVDTVECVEEFGEIDFGLFEGLTSDEIRKRYPQEFARWNSDRLLPHYAYPGGERRSDFRARIQRGVNRMLSAWNPDKSGGNALLVAHRGVIRTLVFILTGAEPAVELGSIHILENRGAWKARLLDDVSHLDRQS